jgi:hypothetical protein
MSEELSSTTLVFREIISSIKKKILETMSYTSQNANQIYEIEKVMKDMYSAIRKVIEEKAPISSLEPFSLNLVFDDILNDSLSDEERDELMYYLRRDLITFPFTLDTIHINSNLAKNEELE